MPDDTQLFDRDIYISSQESHEGGREPRMDTRLDTVMLWLWLICYDCNVMTRLDTVLWLDTWYCDRMLRLRCDVCDAMIVMLRLRCYNDDRDYYYRQEKNYHIAELEALVSVFAARNTPESLPTEPGTGRRNNKYANPWRSHSERDPSIQERGESMATCLTEIKKATNSCPTASKSDLWSSPMTPTVECWCWTIW